MTWAIVIFIYLFIGLTLCSVYYVITGKFNDVVYKRLIFNWPCQDDTLRFIWESLWKK